VSLAQASALAPLAPLCDSLVLAAAGTRRYGFDYGWVRGAGSGAFILGTVLSGQMVGQYGLSAVIWLNAALLAVNAGEKMDQRAGVKMHHGASSQHPVQLHIPI